MPAGDGWAVEVKFDGMRLQLRSDGRAVCLRSRPGRDCTEEFPELAPIRSALGRHRVLLDGELVCLAADGSPDFASLRRRLRAPADKARRHAERSPATYLAFDLLHLDGRSTRELPYERRRELLLRSGARRARAGGRRGTSSASRTRCWPRPGSTVSRASSPSGSAAHTCPAARNGAWVKHKHRRTESFLVTGWSSGRAATPREPAARAGRIRTEASSLPGASRFVLANGQADDVAATARAARPAADSARSAHPPPRAGAAGRRRLPRPFPRARARPDPPRRRSARGPPRQGLVATW